MFLKDVKRKAWKGGLSICHSWKGNPQRFQPGRHMISFLEKRSGRSVVYRRAGLLFTIVWETTLGPFNFQVQLSFTLWFNFSALQESARMRSFKFLGVGYEKCETRRVSIMIISSQYIEESDSRGSILAYIEYTIQLYSHMIHCSSICMVLQGSQVLLAIYDSHISMTLIYILFSHAESVYRFYYSVYVTRRHYTSVRFTQRVVRYLFLAAGIVIGSESSVNLESDRLSCLRADVYAHRAPLGIRHPERRPHGAASLRSGVIWI
jgi:hypothetical protein